MAFKGPFPLKPFHDSMVLLRMLLINTTPHKTFSDMESTPSRKQLCLGLWGLVVLREDGGHGDRWGEHVRAQAVSPRRSRMVNHKIIEQNHRMLWVGRDL